MTPDTEERVRHLRETLCVLQDLLRLLLMYDSLQTDEEDVLDFFLVYDGVLMNSAVIGWWKLFGNQTDNCHWKALFPEEHQDLRNKFNSNLQKHDSELNINALWKMIKDYRHNYTAHLSFDEADRSERRHPFLAPLRITAEIIYTRIHQELRELGQASGFPSPQKMMGIERSKILNHWVSIANAARETLKNFENEPD